MKPGRRHTSHGYWSYAVEVDGKVLRRNRVHLKQEKQITPTITKQVQSPHANSCSTEHKSQAFKTDDPEEHGTREVRHRDGTDHC